MVRADPRPRRWSTLVDGLRDGPPGRRRRAAATSPSAPAVAGTVHRHVDTLVIGGGPAGPRGGRRGDRGRVLLLDEATSRVDEPPGERDRRLRTTTATGIYDDGYVALLPARRRDGRLPPRPRARRVVLATGAHERPLAFAGNDRPGVMLASAARAYLERFGVLVGDRVVVFSANHAGHDAAEALAAAGAVVVVVDPRPRRAGDGATARRRDRGSAERHGRRDRRRSRAHRRHGVRR